MGNANTEYVQYANPQNNPLTNAGIFTRIDNSAKVAALYMPQEPFVLTANSALDIRFKLHAWGTAVTSVTSNFQAVLYYGVSATAASNTAMVTLTNRSYATATGQWIIEFDGLWDSRTQKIGRWGDGYNLTTAETRAAITPVTGVDLTTGGLGFTVGALFGTTGAGNIAYMNEFQLEVL